MTDKLLDRITDAQDIFGLLRRWSPVFLTGEDAGYKSAVADPERLSIVTAEGTKDVESVALDLTDKYGRVDAAWWVQEQRARHHGGCGPEWLNTVAGWYTVLHLSMHGQDLTPAQIDTLARLVLRLAGRQA